MNKVFIVANLKSYKTENESKEWLENLKKIKDIGVSLENKEIIVCPPFQLLLMFKTYILENNLPVSIGAQDVSPFDEGAYTGEVNAKQIKDFADYVLIGHSERRKNFGETDDVLSKKTVLALKYELTPIYLIQNKDTVVSQGIQIIAYEPIFAIGSGNPDTPGNANEIAGFLKSKNSDYKLLYGGSVSSQNVNSFTSLSNISGVLVGSASLDALEFIKIIENA